MNYESLTPSAPFAVVVNDNPTQLTVLSGLVRKAGLDPRAFISAEAALINMTAYARAVGSAPGVLPVLVVTDLYMPGIDGWRFCRLLRSPEYVTFNQVPILVVSATYTGEEPERIAAELGAEAFLSSPVDGRHFVNQIHEILQGRKTKNPLRVLIVEDSKPLSHMLRKAFEANGYQVRVATTVQEAADAAQTTACDVAVFDYYLPDGTGDSLLELFRRQWPECICLMMTTDPSAELALDWMKQGAAAYLRKPFKPNYLIELCSRARRERALLRVQDLLELRTGEVQKSEERFRRLFEHNAAVKLMIDPDTGKIIEANKAAADFYGWSIEELRQMCIQEINILTPDAVKSKMELTRLSGAMRLEFRHRRADKSLRDVEVFSSRIEISGKDVLYSTIHDISDSKMVKKALEESEKRYRALIDNTQSIVYTIGTDGKLTFVSPSWKILLGHESEEVVGHHFGHFVHAEDVLACQAFLLNTMEKEEMQPSVEYRVFHKDGSLRWHRSNITPVFDEYKNLISLIGNAFDFTDSKQAEEQRIKVEALNRQLQKNDSLQRMGGAIAHIFNNQLGVVIGNLEMAIEDLSKDAVTAKFLTVAMLGARKAAEVSSLMLTYLGQTAGMHAPLDLSETCRQSLPLLQAGIPVGLMIKIDLPSAGPTVNANTNQIQQLLTNLVTNAWEAIGDKQGTVYLAAKTVAQTDIPGVHRYPIDWQAENKAYACLEVRDTGDGISEIDIDKLFDPFYSTKFTGRGLGLPVVLGIVKACGGAVTVASTVGKGSTFRVFLPVSDDPVLRLAVNTPQSLSVGGDGTVLLVEDEEMLREMAATMLTRMGYQVLTAKDGVEALEIFKNHLDEIRVVVSDLSMPRMGGWETLTALRQIRPDVPVVLASGHDESTVLAGDHPERPQVFLHKPYQKSELQTAIETAIGS